ncbi:MAG TPA: ABC transporter substrate-binding protein [Acidimicrobiales bacterium]|nr:ABC transporter substrate-binding protein [Acidimicrobiales bacterium]
MKRTRERLSRRHARVLLCVGFAGAALTACNSTNNAVVSTTVVPPPPGCDTSRVVVIGASLDLSGPGAALGHAYLTGLELGIAKVNAGNGVPPRNSCFELMYKNNQGNPTLDDQAILDLVNSEKAGIVVGSFLGTSTATYLGQLGVPEISLSTLQSTFVPKGFPNTYPMTASMESQAFVIAKALKKEKVTSVGLVITNDVPSRQGAAHFASVSTADGFTITGRATVSPSGRGASAALGQVRATHPKVLVVLDDSGAVAAVLSARAALGWTVPVIAGPTATQAGVGSKAGGATKGVSVVVPTGAVAGTGPASAGPLSFRKRLLAALGTSSLQGSIIPYAQTYDAMTMMGNAANGAMGITATDVTTFLQNANFVGVLASYTYTTGAHTGISASQQTVVSLDTLSDGLLAPAPVAKKKAAH